ncbi:helix-turn-helix domain-containing protein [Photobacterium damselae]|uniref:Helix-turn-helix n=1 Tax=Photobacterium damselae TaxID=38293 RepID=A0A2T3Q2C6_PHODM|nr:helix-turn-helix transcriptional regulator [Photobacterium damselae]PSW76609.1 XRE family transcriptional regulator [Photobacterium damselae]SPY46064.1 Helix-turn-helix [Photobacterium damselae]
MPRQPIRNFLALKEQGVNNIAQRLQHALGSQSVTDIANQTGLSRATINQYLNAKNLPSLDRLAVLAKATNHSLKWLLFSDIEETRIADKYRLVVSDDVMSPQSTN